MGYCCFIVVPLCSTSFSTTRAPLATKCVVETYSMRGCPCSGLDSVHKCWRYCFRSLKAFCCLGPHSTFVEPLNMLKKGRLLSASFTMNLYKAAIRSVNFCTSFLVCGGYIWRMALVLLGLASIPLLETRQPSTLPLVTPKTHLSGFNLSLASRMLAKFSVRLEIYNAFFLLITTISSMYESTFLPTWPFSAAFIILQKVGLALCNLSGILR
jgi:hypothetical protein